MRVHYEHLHEPAFSAHLEAVARSVGTGRPAALFVDRTLGLIGALESSATAVFEAVGLGAEPLNITREVHDVVRDGDFDSRCTTIVAATATATYRIELDRMFNGHLGCNEDSIDVRFDSPGVRFALQFRPFLRSDVYLEIEGATQDTLSRLDQLWREQLGLRGPPPSDPAGG